MVRRSCIVILLDGSLTEYWRRQTKEGSGHAKKEDGTEKRYLPKKAWEKMSEGEKQATDEKKQEESKEGKQFVSNTRKVCLTHGRIVEVIC